MHFWQFRLRLQTEPQVSHIYATEMTVRLIIKVNKRSLNYFLPMLDLNHFPSSSTSITQAHDILCVCLLRRHCGCVRFSATYLKCQHSTVLCDRKLNSSVPGFYRCTPHGYAVVASSTVMVSVSFVHGLCTVWQFLSVFLWSEQQFKEEMFLKVLCVVFSNYNLDVTFQTLKVQSFLFCSRIPKKGALIFGQGPQIRSLLLLY